MRWLSMIILAACLALGGMTTGWASNLQEQAKEDTNKAAKAYLQEGLLEAGEGHDAEAAVAFRKAIAIRPDWAEAHSLLGSSLSRAGSLAEAERNCARRYN